MRNPKPVPAATTPSSCDIEARRGALQAELWKVGHTLGMPTSDAQLARAKRLVEIQRELDALPKPEPQETGEAAGIVEISRGFLGDRWAPPPREPNETDRGRAEDPYLRFMVECGQNWE